MRLTVAAEWLNSCAGCEMSLLNMGEDFIACLRILSFVHMPMLIDRKYFEPMGEKIGFEFPEADLGIISGGIRNEEHLAIAEEMRRKCRVIVAMGTCATHGGIPALINMFSNDELFRRYYRTTVATDAADTPAVVVPPLLDRTYALDEKIRVDVHLPGCPPHPDHISAVLTALMNGEQPRLPTKSVCDTCPARREGKGAVQKMRRYTRNLRHQADKPLTEMKCLLENGLLCMGPVTRAGCARKRRGSTVYPGESSLQGLLWSRSKERQPAAGHAECSGEQRHRHQEPARSPGLPAVFGGTREAEQARVEDEGQAAGRNRRP